MMSSVVSWRRIFLGGVALLGGACGEPQPLGSLGDACVRAADCLPGFVCIEAVCSDDLSKIGADSTGPDAGPGAAGAPSGSGASSNSGSGGGASSGGAASGGTSLGGSAGSN